MKAEVDSAFDIAFWFADQALNDNEYLQPQKLQRLLFLAQAYYAVAYAGQILVPGMFVADDMGPVEPNVFRAFSKGRPDVEVDLFLPQHVEAFLQGIWRRFGHHSADYLTRLTKDTQAYRQAHGKGKRTVITTEAMRLSFSRTSTEAPGLEQIVRPKVMRSHTGRPVTVKAWVPGTPTSPTSPTKPTMPKKKK